MLTEHMPKYFGLGTAPVEHCRGFPIGFTGGRTNTTDKTGVFLFSQGNGFKSTKVYWSKGFSVSVPEGCGSDIGAAGQLVNPSCA